MNIKTNLDNNETTLWFFRLKNSISDLSPAMKVIAGHMQDGIEDCFNKEQSPKGIPRAKRKTSTLKSKKYKKQTPRKILQLSGHLARSITSDYSSTEATVGTNVVYGATHQFGAKKGQFGKTKHGVPIPWGNIPARPFMGISNDGAKLIKQAVIEHLKKEGI